MYEDPLVMFSLLHWLEWLVEKVREARAVIAHYKLV